MNTKHIAVIVFCLMFAGCSSVSSGGYYWGKYSYTYHDLLKEPSSNTRAAHEETLRDIIEKSKEKDLRVPPGVHAELAYLLLLRDANEEALAHFEIERKLYPESQRFLERLLSTKSNKRDVK